MRALANLIFTTDFFYSILRVATPLLFASMGAVLSDVAGVPNIALEGMMLIAAFAGMFFSYLFDSAAMGLLFALLFAVLSAGVLAFFTLYYKTTLFWAESPSTAWPAAEPSFSSIWPPTTREPACPFPARCCPA